jgi:hypothetical protein
VSPAVLLGCCQAALARLRADVEQQDLEHRTIVAAVGGGVLGPVSELKIKVEPLEDGRAHLSVAWQARKLGGDRTVLQSFLTAVDLLARIPGGSYDRDIGNRS